ncbi:GM18729 [Drosophila sechellia]|uniref:GM18729 n=1 Tax=Drosophila sechellia TaxID=7238 RepID=B4IIK6_DROSE|nr:GM18729 [Drosophila sechellia]
MFKYAVVICALIACVAAKPGLLHTPLAALPAPVIAAPAPVVTAASSQVVARTFNGIAAAPVIAQVPVAPAPVLRTLAAPLRATAPVAFAAPLAAPLPAPVATPLAAPILNRVAPFAAPIATPFAAPYAAPVLAKYAAPLAYAPAPLNYAAPALW